MMSPKKVTPVKVTRKAAKNAKHVHKDTYEEEAAHTRADRLKLIASLPSSVGLPAVGQKKTPAKKKESIIDRLSTTQET
jgi:hypothetical protein